MDPTFTWFRLGEKGEQTKGCCAKPVVDSRTRVIDIMGGLTPSKENFDRWLKLNYKQGLNVLFENFI